MMTCLRWTMCLWLSACAGAYPGNKKQAIVAAAVAIPAAIAVNAAQAHAARAASERAPNPALRETMNLQRTTRCGRRSYGLYCTSNGARCVYRTQYGFEYGCEMPDCSDGPPSALVAWCEAD
jgi:hypothetical protein